MLVEDTEIGDIIIVDMSPIAWAYDNIVGDVLVGINTGKAYTPYIKLVVLDANKNIRFYEIFPKIKVLFRIKATKASLKFVQKLRTKHVPSI